MTVPRLPDFPWDSLAPTKERASAFSDPGLGAAGEGLVDLSVGTPVDPTPAVVRAALAEASDAHGYPLTWGTADLREAVATWFAARRGVPDVDPAGVLPTIGSKELVAWLPLLLGLGPGDVVAFPRVAYPTYDVGARLADHRRRGVDRGAHGEVDQPLARGAEGRVGKGTRPLLGRSERVPGEVGQVEHRHSSCTCGGRSAITGWSLGMTPILAAPPGLPRSSKNSTLAL